MVKTMIHIMCDGCMSDEREGEEREISGKCEIFKRHYSRRNR